MSFATAVYLGVVMALALIPSQPHGVSAAGADSSAR
jgi:hypothetical protein